MTTTRDWTILILCALVASGCALFDALGVAETAQRAGDVLTDPDVQKAAGGVVGAVLSGNWVAAATNLLELTTVGIATWKATNITRDRRRLKGKDVKPPPKD